MQVQEKVINNFEVNNSDDFVQIRQIECLFISIKSLSKLS